MSERELAAWERLAAKGDGRIAAAVEAEQAAEIARLRAEVERLTRDREDYREKRANEVENLRRERDALAARLGEAEGLLRSLTAGRMVCLSCWQDTDHHSPDCRLATFLTAGARDGGTR